MDLKRKYWSDILLALDAIDHHLVGIDSFELYSAAPTVKDAVERRLIITAPWRSRFGGARSEKP